MMMLSLDPERGPAEWVIGMGLTRSQFNRPYSLFCVRRVVGNRRVELFLRPAESASPAGRCVGNPARE
jgi:hypothetical protein